MPWKFQNRDNHYNITLIAKRICNILGNEYVSNKSCNGKFYSFIAVRLKSNNIRNREPGYYELRVICSKYNVLFVKKKIHVLITVP